MKINPTTILIFVDCEGHGPAPTLNDEKLFEFGAVEYHTGKSFHGVGATEKTFIDFDEWLGQFRGFHLVFISDNIAYDWQFVNLYFHKFLGRNPFGWSGRRISDFYAGLKKDFYSTQSWKKWRMTPHDHNPVNDSRGNVEAFRRMLSEFTPEEDI